MPNNFAHVGLIQLILPNAKIIDARRHPLGCCFSCFKQHFARGQTFTYDLDELGRYYRDYVELMAHFDAVLPGRVHRVFYESMVEDTEAEVRRLLDVLRPAIRGTACCASTRTSAPCAPPAPSRCVSRFFAKVSINGGISSPGWVPLESALGDGPRRLIRTRRSFDSVASGLHSTPRRKCRRRTASDTKIWGNS